jgi:hypothetical protein
VQKHVETELKLAQQAKKLLTVRWVSRIQYPMDQCWGSGADVFGPPGYGSGFFPFLLKVLSGLK